MERKPNIRWKKGEVERVTKEIERFNNKVDYQKRKHPETADILPDRIKPAEFIKQASEAPRQDMKRQLNASNRFLKKDATDIVENSKGLKITKWEKKEYEYRHAVVERQKAEERKLFNIPVFSEQEKKDKKEKHTGSERENNLQPRKFDIDDYDKGKGWEKAKTAIDKKLKSNYKIEKINHYKDVYLEMISKLLGESGDELYDFIKRVPAMELYKRYTADVEDELLQIQFISDPLPADSIAISVLDRWRSELGLEDGGTWEDLESEDE